jgi:hypothetical protein
LLVSIGAQRDWGEGAFPPARGAHPNLEKIARTFLGGGGHSAEEGNPKWENQRVQEKWRAQEEEESGGGGSDLDFDLSSPFVVTMVNGALNGQQCLARNFGVH